MSAPHELTMLRQAAAVRDGELAPTELAEHYLRRIEELDPLLGAYLTVTADRALDDARRAEERLAHLRPGEAAPPLLGVPMPVKDLVPVPGVRHTLGSVVFAHQVAERAPHTVRLLDRAGMVLLGKSNTPEFGLPAYTESRVGPPARTPWDPSRIAGGSSGGAAAAVAAGLAPAAPGSDGGGSIRIPASCCGLVGLKPSRGRVSTAPFADVSGLAVEGPLARTVRDAAALLDVMARPAPGDPYAMPPATDSYLSHCHPPRRRLRVGRLATPDVAGVEVDPEVLRVYEATTALLVELGHEVVDVAQPLRSGDRDAFTPVWAVLAAMTPVPPGREGELMPQTRWLRDQAAAFDALEYARAVAALQHVGRRHAEAVEPWDALLTPTLAQLPPKVGELRNDEDPAADFAAQLAFTPFTAPWNMAGLPAVSLPLGWATGPEGDLPVGMMFGGRHGSEGLLLSLATELEEARPWADRRPPVW